MQIKSLGGGGGGGEPPEHDDTDFVADPRTV